MTSRLALLSLGLALAMTPAAMAPLVKLDLGVTFEVDRRRSLLAEVKEGSGKVQAAP